MSFVRQVSGIVLLAVAVSSGPVSGIGIRDGAQVASLRCLSSVDRKTESLCNLDSDVEVGDLEIHVDAG